MATAAPTLRRPAFDNEGNYLAMVTSDYEAAALRRGECVLTDDGYLVVVPKPINELDENTKRKIRLAKERKAR